ncbi:MAG: HYR domain-containing protein [Bacteroidetes bacterium]|nr:HYR domain-containing protein [Bacteroidota bacterium]
MINWKVFRPKVSDSLSASNLVPLLLLLIFALFLPSRMEALNPGDVSITMVTAPFFIADSNSPPAMDGPKAAYVGFEVCNTSGALLSDLFIEMTDITGTVPGFALVGGQAASQYVGTLQAGECQSYYWYVEFPYQFKDETGSFEITVSDANPGVVSVTDDVLTRNSISANAGGQVVSTSLGPGIYVGQVFYYDVEYTFGNVQNNDEFTFQPAGNLDFDASCYQLVSNEIIASDLGGVGLPVGTQNLLYHLATNSMGGSNNLLTVRYYFRSLCIGVASNALPYAGQTSGGTNFKYTGNFDQNPVIIPPSTNVIDITKTATPDFFPAPPGVVTYSVVIENLSDQFIMIDRIDDILPGPFEYDALTVGSEVTLANSTAVPSMGATGAISWVGNEPEPFPYFSYLIDPMGTITLEYTVNIPPGTADGVYINSVTATMGTYTTPQETSAVGIGACVVDIECPNSISVNTDPGVCEATVSWDPPMETGTCPPLTVMQTAGPASGSVFPVGTTLIEYTVTDGIGNTANCSFTVDVADNEPPVVSCPMDMLINTEPDNCGATVVFDLMPTDNCMGINITQTSGLPSGSFYPIGITNVGFIVSDASGNGVNCTFEVEVVDNLSPEISCPPDLEIDTDPGQCGAIVTYMVPVGTDNCPNPVTVLSAGQGSNTLFDIGTTTVTYMVTDGSSNTATCSFDVTIEDNEDPMLMCPGNITVNNDPGMCDALVNYMVTFSDNCPGATLMQTAGLPSGVDFPIGITTNTYEAMDASGNTASCSFDITVNDNELPTITCPADIFTTVDPGTCESVVNYTVTFDDNCPGAILTQTAGIASGMPFPSGVTINTFEVTDASGNPSTCSFNVFVADNIDPTISCPADFDISTDQGLCGAVVNYSIISDDNCPGANLVQTSGLVSGAVFPVGTTENCFTITDAANNTASCCFDVTVTDDEDPTINCPGNVVVMTDMGFCSAVVGNISASANDNCGISSITYTLTGATTDSGMDDASGLTFEVGITTVEYTVTDDNGNSATCSFTVEVQDLNDLSITCPNNVTVMTDMGQCNAVVNDLMPTTTDNCGVESVVYTLTGATTGASPGTGINDASGETFEVGVTTVEYVVTDVNGNTASCSFTVTVEDNNGLEITCPADVVLSVEAGLCSATAGDLTPTIQDNCGVASVTYELTGATTGSSPPTGINNASGEVFNVGVTTVTYTVTDDNGNMLSCSFTVTVSDTEDPTITCPMDVVVNTIPDLCGNDIDYTITFDDNCPGATIMQTAGLPDGSFFPVGITVNTFVVTDASGNTASCTFEVEVVDNDSPMISCPSDIEVSTDPGTCDAVVDYITPVGTDNCPDPVTVISGGFASGEIFPIGTTTVTFMVTDMSGNTATCSFDVTITDDENPTLDCPLDFAVDSDMGQCGAIVNFQITGADNCMGETVIQVSGIPTGNFYPVGSTTNVFEVTDNAGNSAECTFEVTVEDNENPTISCPADIFQNVDPGTCGAIVDYMIVTNDNCPGETLMQTAGLPSGSLFPVGTTTNTYVVTDAAGNTAECSFDVTIEDDIDPTIACPMDIVVDNDPGLCTAVVDFSLNIDDNCPDATIMQTAGLPSGSDFPVGTTTNTFEVTDNAGNSITCSFDVTVVDMEDPTINCPSNVEVSNDPDECGAFVDYMVPVGTDNCAGSVTTQIAGLADGAFFPVGTTVNEFQVTDAAGNTTTCSFEVTVTDEEDPEIDCPADINVNTDPDICGAVVDIPIDFSDNCAGFIVTLNSALGDGDTFPLGTTTVSYSLEDASGNTAVDCEFDITVVDMTPPDLDCPAPMTVFNLDSGDCEAVVNFDVTATDNCDPNPIVTQTAGGPLQSGDVFPIGSYDFSYEAEDDSGNISTCDFTISVEEFENPSGTLACNDQISVAIDENGVVTITADMLLEGGQYGCLDDYILDITELDCDDVGQITIVTVTDPDTGNSCSTAVTVEDNIPPEIECGPGAVEISCLDDLADVLPPDAEDNCTDVTVTQINQITVDNDPCDDNMTQVILVWIATDEYGNVSDPCEQLVNILRPDPDNFDFPDDISWDCTDYANFPNLTDPTPVTGNLATSGSGFPANTGTVFCGYSIGHTDIVQPLCGNTFQIIRTWNVVDNCTGQVIMGNGQGEDNIQIIVITDTTDPIVDVSGFDLGVNVSQNGNQDCNAQSFLPGPTVSDDCSDWTVTILTPVGEAIYLNGVDGADGGVIPPPGLGIGSHTITYIVTDDCNNTTTVEIEINVIDNTPPTAICDEITNASLTTNGEAIVPAIVFDDGSYDNCTDISFQVRRLDGDCDGNFDDFGDSVIFCCSDIPNNPIIVILEVTDAYGNVNSCEVEVDVEDGIPPLLVSCPDNLTIGCDEYHELYAIPLNNGDGSVLDTLGTPEFYDNCELNIEYTYTFELDNCQEGTIIRTWVASDNNPDNPPVTCTQTIFVEHVSDWGVEFPAHINATCTDGQLPDFGEPVIFGDECELIGISYEDELFTIVADACYKILRHYTLVNWCTYDEFGSNEYLEFPESYYQIDFDGDGDMDDHTFQDGWNENGSPGIADGYIQYTQVIKINDNEAPIFDVEVDGCIEDTDCNTDLVLPYPNITDECSTEFIVDIVGDFGIFQDISADVVIQDVEIGTYEIEYSVTDNCGNTAFQTLVIEVEDCKLPTAVCYNGLVVEIMQTGMIEVFAETVNLDSYDNCPGELQFSFSSDVNDISNLYTCDDIGQDPVEIWVTDASGNQDYCETFIEIQDNMDFCDGNLTTAIVSGLITTEEDEPVEMVMVDVNGGQQTQITTDDGLYSFELPQGDDYTITPMLDVEPLNGVTTYDMVLISQHILGINPLDSPYQLIAADANNSGSISTLDLLAIQKLILVLDTNFPNNTSWRFVDANYVFPNPANPWEETFPEILNINDLATDVLNGDFIAVKTGDVNGSAQASSQEADNRNASGELLLYYEDQSLKAGQTTEVWIRGSEKALLAAQFSLYVDPAKAKILRTTEGLFASENIGERFVETGYLTFSWHRPEIYQMQADEGLFGIQIQSLEDQPLSEVLELNSAYTRADAYGPFGEWLDPVLIPMGAEQAGFVLYQNVPNPFAEETRVGFYLPAATNGQLRVMDVSGKVVHSMRGDWGKGYHEIELEILMENGVYYYEFVSAQYRATRKMIIQK